MKTAIALLVSFCLLAPMAAQADPVLDEIRNNLDEAKKRIELTKRQLEDLEDNEGRIKGNLESLNKNLVKKQAEHKEAQDTLAEYGKKLQGTATAKKDFERNLQKDKQELSQVTADIAATEKKLAALQAAKKALEKSIEVSEDNLEKIVDSSAGWQKNRSQLQSELGEIGKDLSTLKERLAEQEKLKAENVAALAKWRKSLTSQETLWQKLDQRYKQAQKEAAAKQ